MFEGMKASIIVPVYNNEAYVERCINSLISQTYSNIEIIIIDDGSTDSTYGLCERTIRTDARCRLIRVTNGGVSRARNIGLQSSTGNVIFFCDGDDWYAMDMVENMLSLLEENNAQVVVCGFDRTNGMRKEIVDKTEDVKILDKVEFGNRILWDDDVMGSVCNKAFLRDVLSNACFNEFITHCEDMHFLFQLIEKNEDFQIAYTKKKMYYYFHNQKSATVDYSKTIDGDGNSKYINALKKMIMLNIPRELKDGINAQIYMKAVQCIYASGKGAYSNYSKNSLKQDIVNYRVGFYKNKSVTMKLKIKVLVKHIIGMFRV